MIYKSPLLSGSRKLESEVQVQVLQVRALLLKFHLFLLLHLYLRNLGFVRQNMKKRAAFGNHFEY